MEASRRRQALGVCASAALPALWKAIARKGWSHATLARELEISSAAVANLLYGVHRASRRTGAECLRLLGVGLHLWDKACPPNWKPHAYEALRPKAGRDDEADDDDAPELLATGSD